MSEIDYQMALLLNHKFEQEFKAHKNAQKSDEELARLLQEEFEQEARAEAPVPAIIGPGASKIDQKSDEELARILQEQFERDETPVVVEPPSVAAPGTSKCLTDPSWELVDPTPDIHGLFVAFDRKFFWGTLGSVSVSWSKKMTSCAGTCAFSRNGRMCVITLSEPLLKLRPRKDLVETLLHEMIHAYLFLTNNNKDREGHGPEFHKHMYRINKESGTNITVYHNFHDEVKLYQQHWWRCNGPCQKRGPFFGMVRRAMNRKPGPYDTWWTQHVRTCGGEFIKVREPEKVEKKNTKAPPKKKDIKNDIRKYYPVASTSGNGGVINANSTGSNLNIPTTSNIKTMKDLGGAVTKGRSNSANTLVVTGSRSTSNDDSAYKPTPVNKPDIKKPNQSSSTDSTTSDFVQVRNHWQNKFRASSTSVAVNSNNKRPSPSEPTHSSPTKIQKTSNTPEERFPKEATISCPICASRHPISYMNDHIEDCLKNTNQPATTSKSTESKSDSQCNGDVEKKDLVSCIACGKKIYRSNLSSHLDECMSGIIMSDGTKNEKNALSKTEYNCPICMKLVDENEMNSHIDACLNESASESNPSSPPLKIDSHVDACPDGDSDDGISVTKTDKM